MNLLEKCNNCKLKECIGCEYTWSDVKATFEHLQKENENLEKRIERQAKNLIGRQEKIELLEEKLDNSISKDKIKEKLKELEFFEIAYGRRSIGKTLSYGKKIGKLEVLTDLLKEE